MEKVTGILQGGESGEVPVELELNLSDFALFLSVMKIQQAYEATLSIIMDEPDLKLVDVKVEQVVLNKSGKRAIRLDAWAKDTNDRQFSAEMQNDTKADNIKKRSRYYQGLLDTPILKSGKTTKYKQLPSTVIIFITQEDIFGLDRAMYTFSEQCKEVPKLELGDGTQKIFLNMKSMNGSPVLVSLLQYMKKTDINNPDILVKDKRIRKLDRIVAEVKRSEEWEAVRMSILEVGMQKGMELGMEKGIEKGIKKGIHQGEMLKLVSLIRKKEKRGMSPQEISDVLEEDNDLITKIYTLVQENRTKPDEKIIELL